MNLVPNLQIKAGELITLVAALQHELYVAGGLAVCVFPTITLCLIPYFSKLVSHFLLSTLDQVRLRCTWGCFLLWSYLKPGMVFQTGTPARAICSFVPVLLGSRLVSHKAARRHPGVFNSRCSRGGWPGFGGGLGIIMFCWILSMLLAFKDTYTAQMNATDRAQADRSTAGSWPQKGFALCIQWAI